MALEWVSRCGDRVKNISAGFAHRLPAYRTFGALTDDEPLDLPNRQTRPRSGPA
jgi:hypothetical protein